jgi:hypothetical protein
MSPFVREMLRQILNCDKKARCRTCKWHDDFTAVCSNPSSDQRADFTDADFVCECWERRNEDRQESRGR